MEIFNRQFDTHSKSCAKNFACDATTLLEEHRTSSCLNNCFGVEALDVSSNGRLEAASMLALASSSLRIKSHKKRGDSYSKSSRLHIQTPNLRALLTFQLQVR